MIKLREVQLCIRLLNAPCFTYRKERTLNYKDCGPVCPRLRNRSVASLPRACCPWHCFSSPSRSITINCRSSFVCLTWTGRSLQGNHSLTRPLISDARATPKVILGSTNHADGNCPSIMRGSSFDRDILNLS